MAEITFHKKTDVTGATSTSETLEDAGITVTWEDLTGAGFANGGDALICIRYVLGNASTSTVTTEIRIGSTWAGASVVATASDAPSTANATHYNSEMCWIDRVTLNTDDDIYLSISTSAAANTSYIKDYTFFILSLDDLAADDFRFNENTTEQANLSSGGGEITGATVTLPSSGNADDWLILGSVNYSYDDFPQSSSTVNTKLSLAAVNHMQSTTAATNKFGQTHRGLVGYLPSAGDAAVCEILFDGVDASGTTDHDRSAIFALRLEAFVATDHVGSTNSTDTTLTGSTMVQTNTGSLTLTTTGNIAYFAQTVSNPTANSRNMNHRVQADGTDIVTSLGSGTVHTNWSSATPKPPLTSWGSASLTNGTITIDVDCSEQLSGTNSDMIDHTLVAFALELAVTSPTLSLPTISNDGTPTNVAAGVTSDTVGGTMKVLLSTNSTELDATIKSTGVSFTGVLAAANTFKAAGTPGATLYAHFLHEGPGGDSTGVSTSGTQVMPSAHGGSQAYNGGTVGSGSILHFDNGTHTGANNASVLTDGTKTWTVDEWYDDGLFEIVNDTDAASQGDITANTANTATVALSGGTDADFDTNDVYRLLLKAVNLDAMRFETAATRSSGSYSFEFYVQYGSWFPNHFSRTLTATVTDAGPDESGTVSLSALGVPTFTPDGSVTPGGGSGTRRRKQQNRRRKMQ